MRAGGLLEMPSLLPRQRRILPSSLAPRARHLERDAATAHIPHAQDLAERPGGQDARVLVIREMFLQGQHNNFVRHVGRRPCV